MASPAARCVVISSEFVLVPAVASVVKSKNGVAGYVASVPSSDNVVPVAVASILENNTLVVDAVTLVTSSVDALPPTFARVTLTLDGILAPAKKEPSGDNVRGRSIAIEGSREVNATR
jgi:hypothetical protein